MVATVSVGLALIFPAVDASPQRTNDVAATTSSGTDVCAADDNHQVTTVNAEHVWRLRAYEDLDCALATLDDALRAPGNAITLSRQQAERVRALVWSARDAAARIGR